MNALLLIVLLGISGTLPNQSPRGEALSTGCFSNCRDDANRSYGMSITVMSGSSGYWVLFQSNEGYVHDPLLLKATYDGTTFTFKVPDTKDEAGLGLFHGFPGPKELTGKFDKGPQEKIRIPKVRNCQ